MNIEAIERDLQQQVVELRERLARVERDVMQPHSADSAERAVERENDEVVDQIGVETRQAIQQIELALSRIAQGEYGLCVACGDQIAPGRLLAMPESTHCVKCAD